MAIFEKPDKYTKIIGATKIVNLRHHQKCDVYCGRPGPFGNPFVIGRDGTREEVLVKYGKYLKRNKHIIRRAQKELLGKTCGCFCVPQPCHVEILVGCALELAQT